MMVTSVVSEQQLAEALKELSIDETIITTPTSIKEESVHTSVQDNPVSGDDRSASESSSDSEEDDGNGKNDETIVGKIVK